MAPQELTDRPLIMLVGVGDLSGRLLTMLMANAATNRVVLAGRDVEALRLRANLARYTAGNLGLWGDVNACAVDLRDIDATAETLAAVRPDIVFMGASLQSWRVITELPKPMFEELDTAQLGPWLPMHLTLVHDLMRAVDRSGLTPRVVNAAFPDAVNPVLARVGLAPTVGIGNVANMIPALTAGFAQLHHARLDEVSVRLVAQHYVSHSVPRFGHAAGAPYHLTVRIHGERVNDLDADAEVFALLATRLRRLGGVEGQLLTASSAFRVLAAMATDSGEVMHAPGPAGQPGGYPVRVDGDGATVDVDLSLSLADAVRINEEGQRADGIDRIEPDGTVVFTEAEMSVMKRLLGYDCRTMSLADAPAQAEELGARYREFGPRNR